MIQRIWETVPCDVAQVDMVARELGVSPITARLLCSRGLGDLEWADVSERIESTLGGLGAVRVVVYEPH